MWALRLVLAAVLAGSFEAAPRRVNYASKEAGALSLGSSPALKGASALLEKNQDKYAIVPCTAEERWVVIGLSEDIMVKSFSMANFEQYSSMFHEVRLLAATTYPTEKWADLGVYAAEFVRGEQTFEVPGGAWARYLKLEFLSHHGVEYYCTLSEVKVHGETLVENLKTDLDDSLTIDELNQHVADMTADIVGASLQSLEEEAASVAADVAAEAMGLVTEKAEAPPATITETPAAVPADEAPAPAAEVASETTAAAAAAEAEASGDASAGEGAVVDGASADAGMAAAPEVAAREVVAPPPATEESELKPEAVAVEEPAAPEAQEPKATAPGDAAEVVAAVAATEAAAPEAAAAGEAPAAADVEGQEEPPGAEIAAVTTPAVSQPEAKEDTDTEAAEPRGTAPPPPRAPHSAPGLGMYLTTKEAMPMAHRLGYSYVPNNHEVLAEMGNAEAGGYLSEDIIREAAANASRQAPAPTMLNRITGFFTGRRRAAPSKAARAGEADLGAPAEAFGNDSVGVDAKFDAEDFHEAPAKEAEAEGAAAAAAMGIEGGVEGDDDADASAKSSPLENTVKAFVQGATDLVKNAAALLEVRPNKTDADGAAAAVEGGGAAAGDGSTTKVVGPVVQLAGDAPQPAQTLPEPVAKEELSAAADVEKPQAVGGAPLEEAVAEAEKPAAEAEAEKPAAEAPKEAAEAKPKEERDAVEAEKPAAEAPKEASEAKPKEEPEMPHEDTPKEAAEAKPKEEPEKPQEDAPTKAVAKPHPPVGAGKAPPAGGAATPPAPGADAVTALVSCLDNLNLGRFRELTMTRLQAAEASKQAALAEAAAVPTSEYDSIFKKLMNKIKGLEVGNSILDQYLAMAHLCYRDTIVGAVTKLDEQAESSRRQEEALQSLQAEMRELREALHAEKEQADGVLNLLEELLPTRLLTVFLLALLVFLLSASTKEV
eukprot:CAMPEP_0118872992 /NCGR_PEP_ID=MMETSP1163-20130328/14977_1 /TAXON_ID=124430 /ORGANISM="Phaeomonas parva, Strain CCMP2877" /LENGTH=941 /DNA_ID=CAMNT_0006808243 /DNA_START=16 /DNA_END=2841 /DNA_ORIENTATION=-